LMSELELLAAMSECQQMERLLLVVGSVNADIYIEIDRLPKKGETLQASDNSGYMLPGGKGANQAVCAARLFGGSQFIGVFGNDSHAASLRKTMEDYKVDLALAQTAQTPSGQAFILLQADGDNSIILVGGSNAAWPAELSAAQIAQIQNASLVLLQREIPERINLLVAQIASRAGVPVVLDVGGHTTPMSPQILQLLAVLSPNETELARISHLPTDTKEQVIAAAQALLQQGTKNVLVKLGARGSMMVTADGKIIEQPAIPPRKIVDTTGAGDCFTAAFAVALAEGKGFADAMLFGSAAATLCLEKKGAMPSMPSRAETDELLRRIQLNT